MKQNITEEKYSTKTVAMHSFIKTNCVAMRPFVKTKDYHITTRRTLDQQSKAEVRCVLTFMGLHNSPFVFTLKT